MSKIFHNNIFVRCFSPPVNFPWHFIPSKHLCCIWIGICLTLSFIRSNPILCKVSEIVTLVIKTSRTKGTNFLKIRRVKVLISLKRLNFLATKCFSTRNINQSFLYLLRYIYHVSMNFTRICFHNWLFHKTFATPNVCKVWAYLQN